MVQDVIFFIGKDDNLFKPEPEVQAKRFVCMANPGNTV